MQQDSFEVNTLDIQKLVTARQVFFSKTRIFCSSEKKVNGREIDSKRNQRFFKKNETFTE